MRKVLFIFSLLLLAGTIIPGSASASRIVPSTTTSSLPGGPDAASVKSAFQEFKSLSRKERRERIKEVKSQIKHYKAEKKAGNTTSDNTILLVILAILLPPLAVYLHQEEINSKFWIDLLLTLLFWLPGVIYALVVILSKD